MIGPDAFRVIAEFIACEIDTQLQERAGNRIVGGVRHVDDYYLGVKSEVDAAIVLSQLRDILQNFELQINDSKTRIISGLEPVDDIWAQDLRAIEIGWHQSVAIQRLLDKAFDTSRRLGSESPMKLALRRLDQIKIYRTDAWFEVESKLQRIMFHYSHCIDYVLLLLVKRFAIGEAIDKDGWREVTEALIDKHFSFNHHHEICWLLWANLTCRLESDSRLAEKLTRMRNSHVASMLVAGYSSGLISRRPDVSFSQRISSTDDNWLVNIVARSNNFTRAPFGGSLSEEFEHLAKKKVVLINYDKHIAEVAASNVVAISHSKYGYDRDGEDDGDDDDGEDDYNFDYNDLDL